MFSGLEGLLPSLVRTVKEGSISIGVKSSEIEKTALNLYLVKGLSDDMRHLLAVISSKGASNHSVTSSSYSGSLFVRKSISVKDFKEFFREKL